MPLSSRYGSAVYSLKTKTACEGVKPWHAVNIFLLGIRFLTVLVIVPAPPILTPMGKLWCQKVTPPVLKMNAQNRAMAKKAKLPGDLILDRYMQNATEEERRQAYENLRSFAVVLARIDARLKYTEVDSRKSI